MSDTSSFLKELFDYNHHFNAKLAGLILSREQEIPEKSIQLFHHTLNAHRIWNHRIHPGFPNAEVWGRQPLSACMDINLENYNNTLYLLKNKNMSELIAYNNSKGLQFSNSVRDILFHIVNHSTYHRGQIASNLRQHGIDPPVTDYIFFKR